MRAVLRRFRQLGERLQGHAHARLENYVQVHRAAARPFAATRQEHEALVRRLPAGWDERGYLTLYPDVATTVLLQQFSCGWLHWLRAGYAERRRLPGPLTTPAPEASLPRARLEKHWDEPGYLQANPHAQVLVALGLYEDGLAHFWAVSRYQTPHLVVPASWDERGYLLLNADVAQAVASYTFDHGYQHWAHWGALEGRIYFKGAQQKSAVAEAAGAGVLTPTSQAFLRMARHYSALQNLPV